MGPECMRSARPAVSSSALPTTIVILALKSGVKTGSLEECPGAVKVDPNLKDGIRRTNFGNCRAVGFTISPTSR